MKNSLPLNLKSPRLRTAARVTGLLILAAFASLSGQTIEVLVPAPVGIRADQGEARLHGLVGQVTIPAAGNYRITAKEWLNSGDTQRNESFFLNLKTSSGSTVSPLDANAGTEKVVPDIPGPPAYFWRDCGLFTLDPGTYAIWIHHYAVISGQYPQFLNEPMSSNPESVRIVDSLRVTFVPPLHTNRSPLAIDDLINTVVDIPVSGQVLTNDADPDGDPLAVTPAAVVSPAHGIVLINTDGTFSYFPAKGYAGADHFAYQVCDNRNPALCDTATVWIQVFSNTPANERPVANDDIVETQVNVALHANLLTNDFDPDGDPLTVTTIPITSPLHGSVVIAGDGSFIYSPQPGFTGEDAFVYSICDNGVPVLCDEATVFITIHPDTNDTRNDPPLAGDDAFATLQNTPVSGSLAENDQDPNGDALIYETTPARLPEHGTVMIASDGSFTYTPAADYAGPDYFVYRVCDTKVPALCDQATVYITVLTPLPPPNHAPVAVDDSLKTQASSPVSGNVLTNDSDPEGDPLVVTPTPVVAPEHGTLILNPDGTFTYTPTPGYAGVDSFVYQICDNKEPPLCDQGTVHIQIEPMPPPPNHAPVAMDDTVKTQSGKPAEGNVKTNDSDPDGDPLVVTPTPVVAPEHGTLILNPDGTFTYTPTPGYAGVDSF
ncbi:MAG TPA: Ig-like domain-containing protein, partial [bacterium]|nr:Ig-like domain-containing protein [bacterium]